MSSDRKEYVLSDLYEFASGLSKNSKEFGFGSPFLSFKTVFNNYFIPSKLNELANTTQVEQEKCSIQKGDVFLTRTSETMNELGMSCVALKDYPHATFNGFTKRLRPKEKNIVYPLFAGYYFRSPFFRNAINSMAIMTTRASLNNEILSKLPILLPSYETQEKIGKILFNIDKKIELNQKMNQTLEEIGHAIFKHWFINFEFPDSDGKPYKSSGGEMVDSELGRIPKGWKVVELGNLIKFIKGRKPKDTSKEYKKGYLPQILINVLDGGSPSYANPEKMVIAKKDESIMVMDGASSGRVEIGYEGVLGSTLSRIIVNSKTLSNYYLFYLLKMQEEDINQNTTGTSIPHTDKGRIKKYQLALPEKTVLYKFDILTNYITNKTIVNKEEIKSLSQIRDSLLPMLMSGKIRVTETITADQHPSKTLEALE